MRVASMMPFFVTVTFMLGCLGCSKSSMKEAAPKECTEFGQQCEFSPGKLGTCVVRDGCVGKGCFACQSQH